MKSRIRFLAAAAAALLGLAPLVRAEEKDNKLPEKVRAVLANPDSLELYSLDPAEQNDPKGLRGWKVLGKTAIKDPATRKVLLEALDKGMAESKGGAKCFLPRHAIRATADGLTIDLVICFECSWIYVYVGDKDGPHLTTSGGPQPAFDKVLKDAGVTLPKK